MASYNDSILSHFKNKVSPNLWPFCGKGDLGKLRKDPTSARFKKKIN